jgi:sugar lactone lactonase YvrE
MSTKRIALSIMFFLVLSLVSFAQSGLISTAAGNGTAGFSGDGGPATAAQLRTPSDVAVDSAGNLYISEVGNRRIRKVTPTGVITSVAGNGNYGFAGDGGPAVGAQLSVPFSIAVDSAANLYIADTENYRIRKVLAATGMIVTVAGGGTGALGDGGLATEARLQFPYGVAVDAAGNIYIADTGNQRVRKVSATNGRIYTIAGNGTAGFSGDEGPATAAQLDDPWDVAVDPAGNIYIADLNNQRIRKVSAATGIITTVAGIGSYGFSGNDGPATEAQLYNPYGIAVDIAGNVFISDYGNIQVRKVLAASGVISAIAGNGTEGSSGDGGPATAAQLYGPWGVTLDSSGNLYVAETVNQRVRKVTGVGAVRIEAFFPQVAAGGEYSTVFTVVNTGPATATGTLVLTDQQGNPWTVRGTLTDSTGVTQPAVSGSSFEFSVPGAGTIVFSATSNASLKTGWARLASVGERLTGVARYENLDDEVVETMVSVLQSQPTQFATIPVENDSHQHQQTAYAIANQGSQAISIKAALVAQDGTVVDDTKTIDLPPYQQISRYLWQDFTTKTDFKGSVVLRGQAGATFTVLALIEKQGLFTAVPVVSAKSTKIPD